SQGNDLLVLRETAHDFGKIQQGRPTTHAFLVENKARDTLQIQNVQASCGCTTPVWSREPVAPGRSSEINVGYNASAEGPFEKTVTIFYNGGQIKTLTIKGSVYKMPTTPAPLNTTVQLFKQTNTNL
ncbi:MAG: DUF1573 domain-containing protein, partial [Chitinophagaceae bacterium]